MSNLQVLWTVTKGIWSMMSLLEIYLYKKLFMFELCGYMIWHMSFMICSYFRDCPRPKSLDSFQPKHLCHIKFCRKECVGKSVLICIWMCREPVNKWLYSCWFSYSYLQALSLVLECNRCYVWICIYSSTHTHTQSTFYLQTIFGQATAEKNESSG